MHHHCWKDLIMLLGMSVTLASITPPLQEHLGEIKIYRPFSIDRATYYYYRPYRMYFISAFRFMSKPVAQHFVANPPQNGCKKNGLISDSVIYCQHVTIKWNINYMVIYDKKSFFFFFFYKSMGKLTFIEKMNYIYRRLLWNWNYQKH